MLKMFCDFCGKEEKHDNIVIEYSKIGGSFEGKGRQVIHICLPCHKKLIDKKVE